MHDARTCLHELYVDQFRAGLISQCIAIPGDVRWVEIVQEELAGPSGAQHGCSGLEHGELPRGVQADRPRARAILHQERGDHGVLVNRDAHPANLATLGGHDRLRVTGDDVHAWTRGEAARDLQVAVPVHVKGHPHAL